MVLTHRSPRLYDLLSKGTLKQVSKGEPLSSSDEKQDVTMVVKGFIKRYLITNEGALGVQITYGPQDVFSLTLVYRELLGQSIYDGPEVYHYKALCDSE